MSISPEGRDCLQYWTDEAREPPAAETLFTSTPGLEPHTKACDSLGAVSDIREAVAWARSANQPAYVLCTEYSSFPCGARCPNPRAVHDVPIPVRCTVCQSPCAF
jgi:hypothetical protein